MGYTHYHPQQRDFTTEEWSKIKLDVGKILIFCMRDKGILLQREFDEPDTFPSITDDFIKFNGAGSEGCEIFYIQRQTSGRFEFCKTNGRPYDLAVGLCLLRMQAVATAVFELKSNGSWDRDWKDIRLAYAELFNEEPPTLSR